MSRDVASALDVDDGAAATRWRCPNPAWTPHPRASVATSRLGRRDRDRDRDDDDDATRPPRASARASAHDAFVPALASTSTRAALASDARGDSDGDDATTRTWRACFATKTRVEIEDDDGRAREFCVYASEGANAASRASAEESRATLFLLHGCPHTALTWSLVAETLRSRRERCEIVDVVAMDLRGHGESHSHDDALGETKASFDADVMARDCAKTLRRFVDGDARRVVVVGHSMGGAVATRVAKILETEFGVSDSALTLAGLVLIDIVEGSAMKALPAMGALVDARPTTFASLADAFHWSATRGGGTKNQRSASLSLPSQLRETDGGAWTWRVDLRETAPYWRSWYEGLSKRFLAVKAPKLLLLAGNDRLDTELMIAQMQGKFQMTLLPNAGHAIQEDDPESVANALENFLARYVFHPRPTPPSFLGTEAPREWGSGIVRE